MRLPIARALLAAAAAMPLAASAAHAQTSELTARSRDGTSVRLQITRSGEQLCLGVAAGSEAPRQTAPCMQPPATAHDDAAGVRVTYRTTPRRLTLIYGLASPRTARLRVTLAGGRIVTARPRGEPRAYLLVLSGRPAVATARALDHRGVVRGAFDLDPRAVDPLRRPARLARTRDERGRRADVTAFRAPLYRPRSTRRARARCTAVQPRRRAPDSHIEPGFGGGSACTFSRRRIVVRFSAGCAARRVLLYGIAPGAVARLALITEGGRRLAVATRRIPRRAGGGRAFFFSRGDPGPLVRLLTYSRSGRLLATLSLSGVGASCPSISRS